MGRVVSKTDAWMHDARSLGDDDHGHSEGVLCLAALMKVRALCRNAWLPPAGTASAGAPAWEAHTLSW